MTLREKQCLVCHTVFTPAFRHPNQKYCSNHIHTYKRNEEVLENRRQKYALDAEYRETQIKNARNRKLKLVYNISEEDYKYLFEKQQGKCAICESPYASNAFKTGKKRLAVDHCHETGKVRGLLCTNCNISLGGFKDNIDLLTKAVKYLEGI